MIVGQVSGVVRVRPSSAGLILAVNSASSSNAFSHDHGSPLTTSTMLRPSAVSSPNTVAGCTRGFRLASPKLTPGSGAGRNPARLKDGRGSAGGSGGASAGTQSSGISAGLVAGQQGGSVAVVL